MVGSQDQGLNQWFHPYFPTEVYHLVMFGRIWGASRWRIQQGKHSRWCRRWWFLLKDKIIRITCGVEANSKDKKCWHSPQLLGVLPSKAPVSGLNKNCPKDDSSGFFANSNPPFAFFPSPPVMLVLSPCWLGTDWLNWLVGLNARRTSICFHLTGKDNTRRSHEMSQTDVGWD